MPSGNVSESSAARWAQGAGAFALAVAQGDPLSFTSDPVKAVREIARILEAGGAVVASVDNRCASYDHYLERGDVKVKRPGRMRWEYRDPERKTFVSDGQRFFFYVPADRQVVVRDQDPSRSLPALLLSGRSGLLSEFDPVLEPGGPGRSRLRLTPKTPDPEIARVFLDVDADHRIRAIQVEDGQGSETLFEFEDIKENVGLPDATFRFEVPRGVDVITG